MTDDLLDALQEAAERQADDERLAAVIDLDEQPDDVSDNGDALDG